METMGDTFRARSLHPISRDLGASAASIWQKCIESHVQIMCAFLPLLNTSLSHAHTHKQRRWEMKGVI